ncbi:MAG: TadE/TadG family type IV pilus assembly protein [Massilia sp.]
MKPARHLMRACRGAATIEFALVLIMFLMFTLAVTDFSRLLFAWNAATEASRLGARYAVVCDDTGNKAAVLARMQTLLPDVADIALTWQPAGCNSGSCEGVTVTITSLRFQWLSPIAGAIPPSITLPTFSTYLPREIMRQDPNSVAICQ